MLNNYKSDYFQLSVTYENELKEFKLDLPRYYMDIKKKKSIVRERDLNRLLLIDYIGLGYIGSCFKEWEVRVKHFSNKSTKKGSNTIWLNEGEKDNIGQFIERVKKVEKIINNYEREKILIASPVNTKSVYTVGLRANDGVIVLFRNDYKQGYLATINVGDSKDEDRGYKKIGVERKTIFYVVDMIPVDIDMIEFYVGNGKIEDVMNRSAYINKYIQSKGNVENDSQEDVLGSWLSSYQHYLLENKVKNQNKKINKIKI